MTDGDQPRTTHPVADDTAVTAGGDEGALDAPRLEDVDAAIDRVALADPAEVDAHTGVLEAHRVMLLIEEDVAPVDCRQLLTDLLLGRVDVVRVVVEIAHARVSDVERALGDLRIMGRELDEVEQLLVDGHR